MTQSKSSQQLEADSLKIGSQTYSSRLIVGTGKYPSEEVAEKADAITPVPGGVGPMTIAMLMANTVNASRFQNRLEPMQI